MGAQDVKAVIHVIQAIPAIVTLEICRRLPIRCTAAFGAFVLRTIGPLVKADKVARRNLARAYPEKSPAEIDTIVRGIWDNLGRGACEWARIDLIDTKDPDQVEVIGEQHLMTAAAQGTFVVFTAHMANWEVASVVAFQRGIPLVNIYRPMRNPWMDWYIRRRRSRFCGELIPKREREGLRRLYRAMANGAGIGLMVDQKLNEGLPVAFFGRDAMTAPMPADIALRLRCPLLPTRLERLPGSRFRVTIEPPMPLPDSGDKKADTIALMTAINVRIETWVRARPEQWFWVHRRWPD